MKIILLSKMKPVKSEKTQPGQKFMFQYGVRDAGTFRHTYGIRWHISDNGHGDAFDIPQRRKGKFQSKALIFF
jgi:hypothetical protein